MILMSVDLPAPLSPASACTSPGSSSKPTVSSAVTPAKRLTIPSMQSTGRGVSGMGSTPNGWVAWRSVRVSQILRCVRLVEESIGEENFRRDLLLPEVFLDRIEGQWAEPRIALDGGAELAGDD